MRQFNWLSTAVTAFLLVMVGTGCMSTGLENVLNPPLTEQTIRRDGWLIDGKILIIDLSDEIAKNDAGLFRSPVTPDGVGQILQKAAADNSIKAVVLRVDSPGGEVTATDIIHRQLRQFKAQRKLPMYSVILSVGASGAYYITTATDRIYVHPTGVVGSIGVIAHVPQIRELADKIGVGEVTIKTGPFKDMGNPLKKLSDDERKIFQKLIDDMFERFLDVVVAGRDAFPNKDALRPIADGRVYTAQEARTNGLVDEVAYLDTAIADIQQAAGLKRVAVVTYRREMAREANLYSHLQPSSVNFINLDLKNIFGPLQPGFYYLWRPGR